MECLALHSLVLSYAGLSIGESPDVATEAEPELVVCPVGVYFVDELRGWAVGTEGTLVKTSDGGATWTPQDSGTSNHVAGLDFVDEVSGWAVGANETILGTSDGGQL